MKKKMLIVALGMLFLVPVIAYALFSNGGFEDGSFTGWTVEHGSNNLGGLTMSGGVPVAENVTYVSGGWDNVHTFDNVTTGTDNDAFALTLPVVKYNDHSAVVNYAGRGLTGGNNYRATRISQQAALAESDRDPSDNRFHVRFAWAAVLQDPGHPIQQQPYFHVLLTNVTDNVVLYSKFFYSGQIDNSFTWRTDNVLNSGIKWIDWQEVDLDITDNVAVGNILRIEASAAGCAQSGHFGHVYLDGFRSQASATGTTTSDLTLRDDGLGNGWCGTVFAFGGKDGDGPGPWSGAALMTLYFALFLLPIWILKRMHGGRRSLIKPALLSFLIVLALCLAAALPASAGDLVPKAQRFHPTSDGFGTLTLDSADTLGKGDWAFVSTLNLVKRPLNRGDIVNLDVQGDRVHDLATLDLAGAYGFCKNIQLGIDVPINFLIDGKNNQGVDGTSNNLGDIRLNGKWKFLSRPNYGLAFVPYVIFASGDKEFFLSERRGSIGGKLAGHLAYSPKLTLIANLGVQQVGNPTGHKYAPWIQYGVGADYKLSNKSSLVAEINGETTGDRPYDHTVVSPFELLAAYRNQWTPGWTYQVGGGGGLNKGMGAPQWRALVGVSYLFNAPKAAPAPPPVAKAPAPPPPAPKPAPAPKAAPAPPPPPPPPVAKAPAPPPPAPKPVKETISLAIEFDTAKADIRPKYNDELAKVAAYLKKYPETTVTIEGHTDNVGGEKYNQKLSERRAESVKKALVEKFGIDASKITTKGYGLSKPIADNKTKEGKQKNRRIEAIFR